MKMVKIECQDINRHALVEIRAQVKQGGEWVDEPYNKGHLKTAGETFDSHVHAERRLIIEQVNLNPGQVRKLESLDPVPPSAA